MGDTSRRNERLFVERSWPPLCLWVYFLLPLILTAIPAPFLGSEYWAGAAGIGGGYLLIFGIGNIATARRQWWLTSQDLVVKQMPLPVRLFYGMPPGERHVPWKNIKKAEIAEGRLRALERQAFGDRMSPEAKKAAGGSVEKFWCKAAIIVRLTEPDQFGDVALLSTRRSHEAHRVLTQAIKDAEERRGTSS